jgi:hypothetical protein
MSEEKETSKVFILKGIVQFGPKDPYWYRIVMVVFIIAFFLATIYLISRGSYTKMTINSGT